LPAELITGPMVLTGADLYRLDCQACHRANGMGSPPEINSVLEPVRATSPELIRQRMERIGASIARKAANQLAAQAEASLLQRINHGGQKMPAFPDLNAVEAQAVVAYLKQLAGVPGAERKQIRIQEPAARVGEHLVKATCHICHSATGREPTPEELLRGAIPPLTDVRGKSLGEFLTKVLEGAPVTMGTLQLQYRGRMPVFYYLRDEEAAAAYLYLSIYRPTEFGASLGAPPAPSPQGCSPVKGELPSPCRVMGGAYVGK